MSRIKIFCIEGCHGSGKTKIINKLKEDGVAVLDENFIGMPSLGLKPQSFTMELIWICRWFERALELKKNGASHCADVNKPPVYFADRSPYSAILYAEWGVLLKPIIAQNLIDLKRAGIDIVNIYINVDEEVLWNRISDRLKLEPGRAQYNENSRTHMTTVLDFYKSHDDLWHHTVDNTGDSIENVISAVIAISDLNGLGDIRGSSGVSTPTLKLSGEGI
jgi:thymidylate kinase